MPKDYNKLEAPFGNDTTVIDIGMYFRIQQVLEVDDAKFTITFLIDLMVQWQDDRILDMSPSSGETAYLELGFMDYIWLPDIYILDLKSVKVQEVLNPPKGKKITIDTWICV